MWWRVMGDVKCPRADCIYYDHGETDAPCSGCNANMKNRDSVGRGFNFKSKDVGLWSDKATTGLPKARDEHGEH